MSFSRKPLVVTILEKEGSLWLECIKTREGLWAQSTGLICRAGLDFETHFGPQKIRIGQAANWVMRLALANGGKFTLDQAWGKQTANFGWWLERDFFAQRKIDSFSV